MTDRRPLAALACSTVAATTLEFAAVSIPFFGLLLGTASVALDFYLQFALDYSVQQAVRKVQLGQVPASSTAATFASSVFCPIFTAFAPCENLVISVQPVADFTDTLVSATTPPTTFCVGAPGQLMYARVVYMAPVLTSIYQAVTPTGSTSSGGRLVSAAAFANENPSGSSIAGSAGC